MRLRLRSKRHKFGAKSIRDDQNIFYPSMTEYHRAQYLKLLASQGNITDLKIHPVITLRCGQPPITYRADSSYRNAKDELIVEDAKGAPRYSTRKGKKVKIRDPGSSRFDLICRLWRTHGPAGVTLCVVRPLGHWWQADAEIPGPTT